MPGDENDGLSAGAKLTLAGYSQDKAHNVTATAMRRYVVVLISPPMSVIAIRA